MVRPIPGREACWTAAGIVVVTNGTYRSGDRARDDQAFELWRDDGAKTPLTTVAKLVADPRLQAPPETRGITQVAGLTASADGAFFGVHLNFIDRGGSSFAVVRARDGATTFVVGRGTRGEGATDEVWAPSGTLVGYTYGFATAEPASALRQRAIVRDADTGDVVLDLAGQFAGWSADGAWVYVAREQGLFARPVSGGEPVRFSPFGVPVAAARP